MSDERALLELFVERIGYRSRESQHQAPDLEHRDACAAAPTASRGYRMPCRPARRGCVRSHSEREGFRWLAPFPLRGGLERPHGPRLVRVHHDVELVGQPRPEIVTPTLGLGQVDDSDRALELR